MNAEDVLSVLRCRAKSGDVEAMWTLGDAYASGELLVDSNGSLVPIAKNERLARKWLRLASNKGCSDAMLALAGLYLHKASRRGLNIAMSLEKKAWRLGNSLAPGNIAITYSFLGRPHLCFKWLEKSYHITGIGLCLAFAYYAGYGTSRNPRQALCICRKIIKDDRQCEYDRVEADKLCKAILSKKPLNICVPISKTRV